MRQIVILSGKGGTGKTTVTAALAHLASRDGAATLVDADVDAPNLGLLLQPRVLTTTPFTGGGKARISEECCVGCGRCYDVCRFGAVTCGNGACRIDALSCEGCAACYHQCSERAISIEACQAGEWYASRTRFGDLYHALLYPGQENSGKLVSTVRQQAVLSAHAQGAPWIIIDGAPGIGCPVIAASTGADVAVLVTEPTVSGLHDLERVAELMRSLRVPAVVCLNKVDLSTEFAGRITAYCRRERIPILAHIPYDAGVLRAMHAGKAVTEMADSPIRHEMGALWAALKEFLASTRRDTGA